MNVLWSLLATGLAVYVLRLAGLLLRDVTVPAAWEQALRFLPVALLSALVVASLVGPPDVPARLAAVVGAALVAFRTGRMWACILAGMGLYWLLRSLG